MPDAATLPTLQYADLPARWGVSIEQTPSAFRLAVEPSGWRAIPTGYIIAASILLFFTLFPISVSLLLGRFQWPGALSSAVMYLLPVFVMTVFMWRRFRQRVLFVVTADTFTIATMGVSVVGRSRVRTLPRAEVGHVKFNSYTGQLTVQHVGKDLLEIYVSPSREVVEFIAGQLTGALAHPPTDRVREESIPTRPPERHMGRPAAVAIALLMVGVAIILLAVMDTVVAAPLAMYLILLAPVPIGIAFGSQPKKFWI